MKLVTRANTRNGVLQDVPSRISNNVHSPASSSERSFVKPGLKSGFQGESAMRERRRSPAASDRTNIPTTQNVDESFSEGLNLLTEIVSEAESANESSLENMILKSGEAPKGFVTVMATLRAESALGLDDFHSKTKSIRPTTKASGKDERRKARTEARAKAKLEGSWGSVANSEIEDPVKKAEQRPGDAAGVSGGSRSESKCSINSKKKKQMTKKGDKMARMKCQQSPADSLKGDRTALSPPPDDEDWASLQKSSFIEITDGLEGENQKSRRTPSSLVRTFSKRRLSRKQSESSVSDTEIAAERSIRRRRRTSLSDCVDNDGDCTGPKIKSTNSERNERSNLLAHDAAESTDDDCEIKLDLSSIKAQAMKWSNQLVKESSVFDTEIVVKRSIRGRRRTSMSDCADNVGDRTRQKIETTNSERVERSNLLGYAATDSTDDDCEIKLVLSPKNSQIIKKSTKFVMVRTDSVRRAKTALFCQVDATKETSAGSSSILHAPLSVQENGLTRQASLRHQDKHGSKRHLVVQLSDRDLHADPSRAIRNEHLEVRRQRRDMENFKSLSCSDFSAALNKIGVETKVTERQDSLDQSRRCFALSLGRQESIDSSMEGRSNGTRRLNELLHDDDQKSENQQRHHSCQKKCRGPAFGGGLDSQGNCYLPSSLGADRRHAPTGEAGVSGGQSSIDRAISGDRSTKTPATYSPAPDRCNKQQIMTNESSHSHPGGTSVRQRNSSTSRNGAYDSNVDDLNKSQRLRGRDSSASRSLARRGRGSPEKSKAL